MDNRAAILKTLLYSEIFNYPLKKEEIYNFLISSQKISKEEVYKTLSLLKEPFKKKNNYFYISNNNSLISERQSKEMKSNKKIRRAKKIIKIISIIPTIKFIGISGALSMKNSGENDDIDIFIISKKDFTWTTRFLVAIFLNFLGSYRTRNSINFADKICLNMILDENSMYFRNKKQNLYIAHEIMQIIPVFNKDKTFEKFIEINNWTNNFLANATVKKNYYINKKQNTILELLIIVLFKILFVEKILRFLQFTYMKKHISKETVLNNYLGFHPFDYETYVLKNYRNKLKSFDLKY
jgi:D-beta-D-heptose 7-phosphate kinase/D-beta-D-heptose 1-phosphate adenosyltransferase